MDNLIGGFIVVLRRELSVEWVENGGSRMEDGAFRTIKAFCSFIGEVLPASFAGVILFLSFPAVKCGGDNKRFDSARFFGL
jgi:hypothetical protein